ncbi:MAG: hypothetical protein FIB07_14455 [Candidatus Methanoperedens sp.]|nr:hypothetical protein [Candidatus Methanoperedens sp.]
MQEIMNILKRTYGLFFPEDKKIAFKKLQNLNNRILIITLEKEKQFFENEVEKIRNNIYVGMPIKEIFASIDQLSSEVERYIMVQNDDDYIRIIQHLVVKNIKTENEIEEICDIKDRSIVFKYFKSGEHEIFVHIYENINEKIKSIEQILKTIENITSRKEDFGELKIIWNNIIDDEKNKLYQVKIRMDDPEKPEMERINALDNEISGLNNRFISLEKYAKHYLSEESLDLFTSEIKEYMPSRADITYYDILNGMADCIVTELKYCIGRDNEGKSIEIKKRMAKLIYGRLKKGMFVI